MDVVKLRVNLPVVKLELSGSPEKHLPELRKFFAELRKLSSQAVESELLEELPSLTLPFWKLSKEVQKNDGVMQTLNQLSQIEQSAVVRRITIDNIHEITEKGAVAKLNLQAVKKCVAKAFYDVDPSRASVVFVHVMGDLNNDQFPIIIDHVVKNFPHAKFETLQTPKDTMGKTVIECCVFGNYPDEENI